MIKIFRTPAASISLVLLGLGTIFVGIPLYVGAQSVESDAISQQVTASEGVVPGTLVSLSDGDPRNVELASLDNHEYLFGVVAVEGETLAEISSDDGGVLVSTSGDVTVTVSTVNGDINTGDVIGVSSLSGVGAKASGGSDLTTTVGVALADFNQGSANAKMVTATTTDGVRSEVVVGSIPVRLAVNNFYIASSSSNNVLSDVGERIIGRSVTTFQVIVAFALAFTGILIGGAIIWNAVHGSFISLGRNPLSGSAVFNGLFYVTLLSITVMVGGLVAGYLILLL